MSTTDTQPPSAAVGGSTIKCHGLDTPKRVCFYEQDFYVLSNFSAFNVYIWKHEFQTAEHAYHWKKFADHAVGVAGRVRFARSAHDAFKLAQLNRGHRRDDWDDVKTDIMLQIDPSCEGGPA